MLLSFSGDKAMVSLAAATIIQKIADSNTAIVNYLNLLYHCNYATTLTTVVFYIPIFLFVLLRIYLLFKKTVYRI